MSEWMVMSMLSDVTAGPSYCTSASKLRQTVVRCLAPQNVGPFTHLLATHSKAFKAVHQ